jgi:hypothetical protein
MLAPPGGNSLEASQNLSFNKYVLHDSAVVCQPLYVNCTWVLFNSLSLILNHAFFTSFS